MTEWGHSASRHIPSSFRVAPHFPRHSGARCKREPGIQKQVQSRASGFRIAAFAASGMTEWGHSAARDIPLSFRGALKARTRNPEANSESGVWIPDRRFRGVRNDGVGAAPHFLHPSAPRHISLVIPGRAEGANPESRSKFRVGRLDSGFARFARAPE
jgi:hypothetical protein